MKQEEFEKQVKGWQECPLRHGHGCRILGGTFSCNATDEVLNGEPLPYKCPLRTGRIVITHAG
jgi:hypothetical protein